MTTGGKLPFEFAFSSRAGAARRREPEAPFRMLVCADLSGSSPASRAGALADRKPLRVDIDSLEKVFARLSPRATLSIQGTPIPIDFPTQDDFHPDSLLRRVPLFGALRALRADLSDPKRFAQAAAALGAGATASSGNPSTDAPASPPSGAAAPPDAAADIERLLGRKPQAAPPTPASTADNAIQNLIRGVVAPHIVPSPNPRQQELVASVDGALAQMLRQILHDPAFRQLEASWRNVARLVGEVGGDDNIEIHLLDVTKAELLADARAHAQALGDSVLGRLVVEGRSAPIDPWSVLILDPMLDASAADLALLAAMGSLASAAGAALLAGVDGSVLGCGDSSTMANPSAWQTPEPQTTGIWQSLRQLPSAASVGLAAGRLLLRQPYGARSDPIDTFKFEEITDPQDSRQFLWGSPAAQLGLLAALAYRDEGWSLDLDSQREIGDLPAYSYKDRDGDAQLRPSAEALLSENAAARFTAAGIMPLMGRRDRHSVHLMRWQSMADPIQGLRGPWA